VSRPGWFLIIAGAGAAGYGLGRRNAVRKQIDAALDAVADRTAPLRKVPLKEVLEEAGAYRDATELDLYWSRKEAA
jgi:hypothetical protein